MKAQTVYDIAVIGGGINGCGIARDAQGRGLSVYLAEMGDLAGATSSASTKLIHGGLRYLEHYEFRLVREALIEREVLYRAAPHIIWPLRFVLPHHKSLRPRWLIRLGLFLYDHLGGRKLLPGTRSLDLTRDVTGQPLKPEFTRGFEYSDCWVEDSRMVVLNARDAADRGAVITTRRKVVSAERVDGLWRLITEDVTTRERHEVRARALVNAGGPWVEQNISGVARLNTADRIRMVKGSHIVVDRIYDHDRAYIFQNGDGRICFAVPYEQDFTLIGTTDVDFRDDPATVTISDGEVDYLIGAVNEYFRRQLTRADLRWSYAGVRPLYDDGASKAQEATRDYVLKLDAPQGEAPLLSVFGGKITTFRRLAESALAELAAFFPQMGPQWTHDAALPGGDFTAGDAARLAAEMRQRYPFLSEAEAVRLVRAYGTRVPRVLGDAASREALGPDFGGGITAAEVIYLMDQEWAVTADDVLWRRSKRGLRVSAAERATLDAFMAARRQSIAAGAPPVS